MSFDTIDLLTAKVFQVSWDLGRRCNYDCSYCPVHRHDNFSPHASLDELKANSDFLFTYIDTYMKHRKLKHTSISFTGGEPTVNPNFIPFIKYLKNAYQEKYKDSWSASFSLTSNGAMSKKMAHEVMTNMQHCTVSYHAESDNKLKQRVKDRMLQFHTEGKDYGFTFSVNVMFHAEHFDECKELCEFLDSHNIKYVPRIIGEEAGSRTSFAHQYTDEQLDYIKNYWKYKNQKLNDEKEVADRIRAVGEPDNEQTKVAQSTVKTDGWAIGRPCCGSREMCLSSAGNERKGTFVDFRNFKGWYCSVNWFFLHLEQQTDSVFHHQTCQAQFGQTRGPIGKISEGDKIIANLKQKLESKTMDTIICPKQTCGCGLCAPKSGYLENYKKVLDNHIDSTVFEHSDFGTPNNPPIIPGVTHVVN